MITWPEIYFNPINLWNVPKLMKPERTSLFEITKDLKDYHKFIITAADDERYTDAEYKLGLLGYTYERDRGWYLHEWK